MPAKSVKQRRAMAIAEHAPAKLYKRNAGMKNMVAAQLAEFTEVPEKTLPAKRGRRGKKA